jgi:opacity protein-like surface antigen
MVATEMDPNDLFAIGGGARFKLTSRLSFNAEYYYVVPPMHDNRSIKTYNPLSIGIDLETGGHVFQIHVTNSLAMIEKGFIGETTGDWRHGGIHLGFNISRVFTIY